MTRSSITNIFILIIVLSGCKNSGIQNNELNGRSEKSHYSNKLFIIPQSENSLICKKENNQITEIGQFPKSILSKSIIIADEFICSIDSIISIYDIKGNLLKQISGDFTPTSLNAKNKVLYLGGKAEEYVREAGEIFGLIDLNNKDFEFKKIKLPIDISYGKSIDDILILKNKLLLVDNIVFPKYLLEYDISDSGNPKHIATKELANNGTYEHIIKGDINENWLVLLSSTVGRGGSSDHIVIEGKTNGELVAHRLIDRNFYDENKMRKTESFNDICLKNNLLYVLIDSAVYSLDLNKEISRDRMTKIDPELKSIHKIIRTPDGDLILTGRNNKYELIR